MFNVLGKLSTLWNNAKPKRFDNILESEKITDVLTRPYMDQDETKDIEVVIGDKIEAAIEDGFEFKSGPSPIDGGSYIEVFYTVDKEALESGAEIDMYHPDCKFVVNYTEGNDHYQQFVYDAYTPEGDLIRKAIEDFYQ